jgi:hypothetical protein
MTRTAALFMLLLFLAAAPVRGQDLPTVDQADRARLQRQVTDLLVALDRLRSPLPPETEKALRALFREKDLGDAAFTARVQKLLDPLCLAGVSINPESRVKAQRGPAGAGLRRGEARVVLVKVVNEAGSTPGLKVSGPQVSTDGNAGPGKWLEAWLPMGKRLTGGRLEYLPLRLVAHESGKREATLRFDVGQGTQDLGFRAEVPVLFTVH